MSSPSSAINSDAAMVQGRPLNSEANEQAVLDGMKGMHLTGGNGNSSHPTSAGGMGETTAKQSNKHNNAGKPAHINLKPDCIFVFIICVNISYNIYYKKYVYENIFATFSLIRYKTYSFHA